MNLQGDEALGCDAVLDVGGEFVGLAINLRFLQRVEDLPADERVAYVAERSLRF